MGSTEGMYVVFQSGGDEHHSKKNQLTDMLENKGGRVELETNTAGDYISFTDTEDHVMEYWTLPPFAMERV